MEWNPPTLELLSQFFMDTLSPLPELRHHAEKSLSDAADAPNYGVTLLRLLAEPSVDERTRQCAAVNFENHLKSRWVTSWATSSTPIPHGEKEQIKTLIVPLMLSATPKIQAQIIKALAVIGNHQPSFAGDEILQQIVIPNVMLSDEDQELFKMNYMEFIKRDMEDGSGNVDTRRRIACELLKGVAGKIKDRIIQQIHKCLALFAENPVANWKYKECAIHLVVSLSTIDVVDVESFFRSVIVPELQCEDVNNSFPMLKAAAFKFFTMFRVSILKHHVAMPFFGDVVRFLGSDSNVVRSYAAICIEKLLLVKENHKARYTSFDISPFLGDFILALENPPNSEDNQYVARCIVRVLQIADISSEVGLDFIIRMTKVLDRVCENPKNPAFNHYLFAAVATLVRRACEKHPSLVPACDDHVLWRLMRILDTIGTPFLPYAFQLYAELVDLNRPCLPQRYLELFDLVVIPGLWQTPENVPSENVPALVRLFQSCLQQAPDELNREGRMGDVLGIFKYLMSSPSTAELGVDFIEPVLEILSYDVIEEYMGRIWVHMVTGSFRTQRIVKRVIILMSLFLAKHGERVFVDSMTCAQPNLFRACVAQLWRPHLKTITGYTEVKLSAIASTKLLVTTPLSDPGCEQLWGELLESLVTLLTRPSTEEERVVEDHEPDFDLGEAPTFTHLLIARAKTEIDDPFEEIKDPKHFLVDELASLSSRSRGRFLPLIKRYLSPANLAALLQLCKSHKLAIV